MGLVRMHRGRSLSLLTMVTLTLLVPVSVADEHRVRDGADAHGPLDLARVKHGHRTTPAGVRRLLHIVRLDERWPVEKLRHQGYVHLFFDLPGRPDWREERAVWVTYDNGRLRAELVNFAADPPFVMREVRLRRPDGRTLRISFRRSALRRRPFVRYDWYVISNIEQRHPLCGGRDDCHDRAPDGRQIRHRL